MMHPNASLLANTDRHDVFTVATATLLSIIALSLFSYYPAFAQEKIQLYKAQNVEQEKDTLDNQEALKVMRTAFEDFRKENFGMWDKISANAKNVKIVLAGTITEHPSTYTEPVSNTVKQLAEKLAMATGYQVTTFGEAMSCEDSIDCRWAETSKDTEALVAVSLPDIQNSKATLEVRRWLISEGKLNTLREGYNLKRGEDGQWKIAKGGWVVVE